MPYSGKHTFAEIAKRRAQRRYTSNMKLVKEQKERVSKIDTSYDPERRFQKYQQYQNNPVGFAEEVLGIVLWEKQKDMLNSLCVPPYRVFVCASHGVGKTFVAAVAVLWMGLCFPRSIVLSTAPTQQQVQDLMWRTIRVLAKDVAPDIMKGFSAPEYEIAKDWFGIGRAASSGDAFQGYHAPDMLIVLDEAVGVPSEIWEAVHGMDNDNTRILAIMNPTDVTSHAYQEYLSRYYETIHISGLEHPNVQAYCNGGDIVIPGAIQGLHWESLLKKWSDTVEAEYKKDTDVEFPPDSGQWYRPGALAESRLLGRWPLESGDSFFGEMHVAKLLRTYFQHPGLEKTYDSSLWDTELQVGVDIARSGVDFSCISVRYQNEIIDHTRINGQDTIGLTGILIEVLHNLANEYEIDGKDIPVICDITGIGAGLYDVMASQNYNVLDLNFSQKPYDTDKYANARTELYALFATQCKDGDIMLTDEIAKEYGYIISKQLMAQQYTYTSNGKFILIPKTLMRKKTGMSPDDTDAICMACYPFYGRLSYMELDGLY